MGNTCGFFHPKWMEKRDNESGGVTAWLPVASPTSSLGSVGEVKGRYRVITWGVRRAKRAVPRCEVEPHSDKQGGRTIVEPLPIPRNRHWGSLWKKIPIELTVHLYKVWKVKFAETSTTSSDASVKKENKNINLKIGAVQRGLRINIRPHYIFYFNNFHFRWSFWRKK